MHQSVNEDDGYRCPQCQSHSTQSICLAYKQAVRTGYSGYESVSQFAEEIAPPKPKDDIFGPSIVACATAVIALWQLPAILDRAGVDTLTGLSPFSWPILALSCICGWIIGAIFAFPAIRYNAITLPPILREWRKGMICKRCSHRWQRKCRLGLSGLDDE